MNMCLFYTDLFIILLFGLGLSFLWWFLLVRYMLYLIDVSKRFLSFSAPCRLSSVLGRILRTANSIRVLLLVLNRMVTPPVGALLDWPNHAAISGAVDSHMFRVFPYAPVGV